MKKNYMMRIASVLLVLVLLTTCVISGTFAKYVTSEENSDEARIAKWGVTITAETPVNDEYEVDFSSVDGQIIVNASEKTLAPGSAVKFATFDIAGTPEVEVKVTYTATLTLTGWTVDSNDYVPIVFVINGVEYAANTVAELKTKVEGAINGYSKVYDEGTNLADRSVDELTVSVKWAFSTSAENDKKDTALGNAGTLPTIDLELTCTVTQVD